MSREIKFRAWFGNKTMCEVTGIDLLEGVVWVEYPNGDKASTVYGANCVIMQYTGLKDLKGKEIYEGDIVEAWFPGMPNDRVVNQEIMFVEGCFGCGNYPLKIMDRTFLKIIGNIYETPELLEK